MKLRIIEQGKNRVSATLNESGCCEVLDFLATAPSNYQSSAKGFKSLFQRYAQGGRQMLTDATFHEASRENDIWEFIKGSVTNILLQRQQWTSSYTIPRHHKEIAKSQKTRHRTRRYIARTIFKSQG